MDADNIARDILNSCPVDDLDFAYKILVPEGRIITGDIINSMLKQKKCKGGFLVALHLDKIRIMLYKVA